VGKGKEKAELYYGRKDPLTRHETDFLPPPSLSLCSFVPSISCEKTTPRQYGKGRR
jgi:hypothetical protein